MICHLLEIGLTNLPKSWGTTPPPRTPSSDRPADCNASCADVVDVIDGRKLFNQLLLTNLRNCNYFTHLPPKSLIFHHPCNQNSFHNNNPAYLPLTLNQEDIFKHISVSRKYVFLLILMHLYLICNSQSKNKICQKSKIKAWVFLQSEKINLNYLKVETW